MGSVLFTEWVLLLNDVGTYHNMWIVGLVLSSTSACDGVVIECCIVIPNLERRIGGVVGIGDVIDIDVFDEKMLIYYSLFIIDNCLNNVLII